MYVPKHHEETDAAVLHSLIKSHPLGAWVTQADGELLANHIPFLLDSSRGEHGTLIGHVARSNRVWQSFSTTVNSVVIFQGSEAYITPSWYPSKHEHGKAVPTWNYVVVHAHGVPRTIEDRDWLLQHVTQLSNTHEAGRALPWKVSDAPQDFIEQLLNAIVGIEIPIAKLVGKWKVSQNRPEPDKLGVVAGLLARDDAQSVGMASLVNEHVSRVAGT
ncbi:FMN-binding negative transcriptional regulator [Pseudolysobacter antarcticus]|uniref:FMN-binding negative transcriptional regulator n=1 Tax=Pseudolysobacter antarcticus TaxID=2511995 RepID=A0A411HPM9_9GAMM|nr:FMN-binding negative transcriptional regulator [Pseudolysobacter antarcticus]QBB72443.1 FMN-binding negative transcriptional regulator [Pseudolysobacter antarcticus]